MLHDVCIIEPCPDFRYSYSSDDTVLIAGSIFLLMSQCTKSHHAPLVCLLRELEHEKGKMLPLQLDCLPPACESSARGSFTEFSFVKM